MSVESELHRAYSCGCQPRGQNRAALLLSVLIEEGRRAGHIGTDLESLRAAHLHALILIEKTMRFISDVADWRGWRVVITDAETNQRLLTVLFPARGLAARS